MEQRPAAFAGSRLDGAGPGPRSSRPTARRAKAPPPPSEFAILDHRRRSPRGRYASQMRRRPSRPILPRTASHSASSLPAGSARQPRRRQQMQQPASDAEARPGRSVASRRRRLRYRIRRQARRGSCAAHGRRRRSSPGSLQGQRLDSLFAQIGQRKAAGAFGEPLAPGIRQQAEDGRIPAPWHPAPRTSSICAPVLVTWSAPRMIAVMAKSTSSTTEVSV